MQSGDTILLGSFSKIAFPGLRVGWAIGPRHFIARLTEAKEASDLHSDQLSQAVLLRFAESGRLEAHRKKMLAAGARTRLKACLAGCANELPAGSRYHSTGRRHERVGAAAGAAGRIGAGDARAGAKMSAICRAAISR